MMRLVGLWAPREAIWRTLLSGGSPFERMALERRNWHGDRSRSLGCDLSGHWPTEASSELERDLSAAAVANRVELLLGDYLRSSTGEEPAALAAARLSAVVGGLASAPAHLPAHSVELMAHDLLSWGQHSQAPRGLAWWVWVNAVWAVLRTQGVEGCPATAAELWPELSTYLMQQAGELPPAEEAERMQRSWAIRNEVIDTLMATKGALPHYLSRALGQRLFGDAGYLGTPFVAPDDLWRSGAYAAHFLANGDLAAGAAPDIDQTALYANTGGRPLVYAAAKWLLAVRSAMVLTPDRALFSREAMAAGSGFPQLRQSLVESSRISALAGLDGPEEAARRTLLPVVTEDVLVAVVSAVIRYQHAITPEGYPGGLEQRAIAQFLLLLGDPPAASDDSEGIEDSAPSLSLVTDPDAAYSSRCEVDWDDRDLLPLAAESCGDWRVEEILLPLLASVVAAHLRANGYLAKGECMQARMPAFSSFGITTAPVTIRRFLQACGAVWKQRGRGLTPDTAAAELQIDADELRGWLEQQPFSMSTIEELLIGMSAAGEELSFALAGGLLDSQAVRGHCLPGWLQEELAILEEHLREGAPAAAAPPAAGDAIKKAPKGRGGRKPRKPKGAQ